jgi:hypothetical protein
MPKPVAEVALTEAQVAAIQAWEQSQAALNTAKQAELVNRLAVINDAGIPFAEKEEGGQTVKLFAGWRLALKRVINYTVENDQAKIAAVLTELHAVNPEAAPQVIAWKPYLVEPVYKQLGEEGKRIMAQIVTSKPGTPSLELKAPTEKKG